MNNEANQHESGHEELVKQEPERHGEIPLYIRPNPVSFPLSC